MVWHRQKALVYIWNYPLIDETAVLTLQRVGTDWQRLIPMTGPDSVFLTVPRRALIGPGIYAWTLTPLDENGVPLTACAINGRFTLLLRPRTAAPYPAE